MDIRISKETDVPLREQLFAQLLYLIATRKLKPGDTLPSVRALARRLKIHHNTVSEAYQSLAERYFLVRKRGSRLVVRDPEQPIQAPDHKDLDDLINDTIRAARSCGFNLQQFLQRARARMLEEPPDHVLALSIDPGMCKLFEAELNQVLKCPVKSCSPHELLADPALAIGALAVTPPGVLPSVSTVLPKTRPAVTIAYSDAEEQLEVVRKLREPSLVAVVSISEVFLEIARGLLGPVTRSQHSLMESLLTEDNLKFPPADVLFCDAIAYSLLRNRGRRKRVIPYRLISEACLEQIAGLMADFAKAADRDS